MGKSQGGRYSDYGIDALYPSGSKNDDMAYAAAWLYRATKDATYLNQAISFYDQARADGNL